MGHDFVDFPVNKFFQKHNAMTLHVLAICVRASQWWYVWYEVPRNVQPHVPGGGGDSAYERGGDTRRLA